MSHKVLRTIYLDLDTVEKIKKLSVRTKVPQAEYIREAINLIIEKYKRQLR